MSAQFCPRCFAELPSALPQCLRCGLALDSWERDVPYSERLIHALGHPNPEVRMGAIIALGGRRETAACAALLHCALIWPSDVVQGLEIVRALQAMEATDAPVPMLVRLAEEHPAHAIRRAALGALDCRPTVSLLED